MLFTGGTDRQQGRLDALHERLGNAPLTYPQAGMTRRPAPPPGYRAVRRRDLVGRGQEAFDLAVAHLRGWGAQHGAGLRVYPAFAEPKEGTTVLLVTGAVRLTLVVPCRVVWSVAEPGLAGFGYGTLPGHPVHGEEAFLVERDAAGDVWFDLVAYSRPAAWGARLAGRAGDMAQRWFAARYARSVRQAAAAAD
jgi:uncharacterized protein (UPF0548 family)